MIREVGTVDDSPMSHGDAFTNKCRKARIDMNNGPVLNIRSLFDCYRLVICSNNNLIPDAGVFFDGDRADPYDAGADRRRSRLGRVFFWISAKSRKKTAIIYKHKK